MTAKQLANEEPEAFLFASLVRFLGLWVRFFDGFVLGVSCLFLTAMFPVTSLHNFEVSYSGTL